MRSSILVLVCAALSTPAAAQQPAAATSTARALVSLEDGWTRALIARDTVAFRRLLHPRFVYTENADVMTANDVIRGVVGPDTVRWAANQGMVVHDFGETAVVTGILAMRGRGKSGPFNKRYRFTDTWMRQQGRWQIVAAQDYLIP
jgi:ketosteroid isomerase-like protein